MSELTISYQIEFDDVETDEDRHERRLLLEERMAPIGTLAASAGHGINNALVPVLNNQDFALSELETLYKGCGDAHIAYRLREIIEALGESRDGARRIRAIAENLRTFSRVYDAETSAIDIRKPIEAAANMAWSEIRHRARLTKDFGDVPLVVGNEAHLAQVFLWVLIGAARAIEPGRAHDHIIQVATRADPSGDVIAEIHHTGACIPPGLRGLQFEPFLDSKEMDKRVGVGLTISSLIVRAFGGKISMSSEKDSESTFRIQLPKASMPNEDGEPDQISGSDAGRARRRDALG